MPKHPRLPSSGIYTEEGFLFHHNTPQPLTREELERLREHDIPYQPRTRFTPEEDERIKKNWARFAKKHNLDYNLAPNYAGVPGYKAIFDSMEERVTFNTTTRFWPKMCRKLPHRSAVQVRGRIGKLFDAAILEGHAELAYSKVHQWSGQETEKLLRYYKIYGMSAWAMKHIGDHMKLPIHTCQNHLRSVLARTGPVPDHLRKKLWFVTTKQCSLRSGEEFDRRISKQIRKGRLENVNQYDNLIPWNVVAQRMVYSVELVQDAWHRLLRFLQSQCNHQRESGKGSKESWNIALKEVFDAVPAISCEDFSSFLHILSGATPCEAIYDACSRRLYDWQGIRSRLEEEGIVGFYSGGCEEHEYLFKKTRKVAHRAHQLLFRRLRLPYTLKERIHILSLAYDYQCGFSPRYCPDDDEVSVRNSDVPERYRFKNPSLKNHGFPALSRRALVEALIVYSLSHFDDWIPPTALKRYVKSTDILSMFLERKDNSELINQKDIDTAISFLDLDVGSETSSSESEPESSSGSRSNSEEENNKKASTGAQRNRKRQSFDEESDRSSERAFSKKTMSNADRGDRALGGASAKIPGTSEHLATAASSSNLNSQDLDVDVSVKKKRRKYEAALRDSTSSVDGASKYLWTGDTVEEVNQVNCEEANQLDSSGIEILDVRKATDYSFKSPDPVKLIESKGVVGFLNAFAPRKKKHS
ncbi:hypothetical protein V3C99_014046 [Haemonchus contortus]